MNTKLTPHQKMPTNLEQAKSIIQTLYTHKGNTDSQLADLEEIISNVLVQQKNCPNFQRLLESVNDVVWATTVDGEVLYINTAVEWVYGHPVADFINNPNLWHEVVHPDDRAEVEKGSQQLFQQGQLEQKYRIVRADGEIRWLRAHKSVVFDINDKPIQIGGIATDITEQMESEKALHESEVFHRFLLKNISDAIFVTDDQGTFIYICPNAHVIFGYRFEEIQAFGHMAKLLGDLPINLDSAVEQLTNIEHEMTDKFDQKHFLLINIKRVSIKNGTFKNGTLLYACRDITERRQMLDALRISEAKFRSLAENSPNYISIVDRNGIIKFVNRTISKVSPKEMLGNSLYDYLHNSHKIFKDALDYVFETGKVTYVEYLGSTSHSWYESRIRLIKENGKTTTAIIHTFDISKRKLAEQALQESEERYKRLVEVTNEGIIFNDQGVIVDVNPSLLQMFGYEFDELIGKDAVELLALPEYHALIRKNIANRFNQPYEAMGCQKDGSIFPIELQGKEYQYKGKMLRVASVLDITERKQAEHKLNQHVYHLESLATLGRVSNETQDMNKMMENALKVTLSVFNCDRAWLLYPCDIEAASWRVPMEVTTPEYPGANILNVDIPMEATVSEMMRVNLSTIGPIAFGAMYEHKIAPIIAKQFSIQSRMCMAIYPKIGQPWLFGMHQCSYTRVWTENELQLFSDFGQHIANRLEVFLSLDALASERASLAKKVEERTAELSQANAELARASRLKDEFLANMSHELRTPLNAILNMSELLTDGIYGEINAGQLKAVGYIETGGRHLLALINDILDLSRIEAGKMKLEPENIIINNVCHACMQMIKQIALKKQVSVLFTYDENVKTIFADERAVKQILVNLLNNAVKFTPSKGKVTLELQSDKINRVANFNVIDTGIGISEHDLDKLFKPFMQIDSSLSRHHEGTGLGLALVYRLVELHGGSVCIKSEVGKGSTFTVSLPWQENAKVPYCSNDDNITTKKNIKVHHAGAVVLVAEDNETNIVVVQNGLTAYGYKVIVSRDGAEAIKRAKEIKPAVILMDIQMPGMNGLEAIKQIRANEQLAKIPIIALTALAMPGDKENCLDAGANVYLSKPVNIKRFVEEIERLLT